MLPKLYNRLWLIVIFLAGGLYVMYFVSGNNVTTTIPEQNLKINCKQTDQANLQQIDTTELSTIYELSEIKREEIIETSYTKNSVPAITNPKFSTFEELNGCIPDGSKVVVLNFPNETKVYPEAILAQHLLVNDVIDNQPVLLSYCVLCNSFGAHSRSINSKIYEFGHSGLLYKNNDLLFDTTTESLWSQYTGRALVGEQIGNQLAPLPFEVLTIENAKLLYPDAKVLNFDTGFRRDYADQTYLTFADTKQIVSPVTNSSSIIDQKETVVGINLDTGNYAIPLSSLSDEKVQIEADDKILSVTNKNGVLTITSDEEIIPYKQSYWYVWFDFYPDTKILSVSN